MSDQDRISPYNIKQTCDENKEKYQSVDYKLIQYQILKTNITRTEWQTVRRINSEILGVKGLRQHQCDWQLGYLIHNVMCNKHGKSSQRESMSVTVNDTLTNWIKLSSTP